ncbi:tetratricopeptide repeat protein, partial [Kingella oralis]|uniref:tetratricopeptide repeat protein n=1 Tax=Kingella oralis TaxID=505 RepID=UPI0034E41E0A
MTPHQLKTQQQRHRQQIQNYQHQQLAQELQDTHDYTQHTHGETSPQHAQSLLNLGAWHTANGDYAAAEPLLKQAVHIQRQHSNPNALAQALNQLAINQLHTAQAGEAQHNLEEALTLATEADLTAQINDDLGNALYTQENLAQALHHYEQAAARFERLYGMHHPKTAQAYTHAAAVYRQQEHAQEALSILQHTTQILETTAPTHHPS